MIHIYSLEGCGYSQKALDLLKEHKLSHKIIEVTQQDKNKYKKMNKMETFPQIFIVDGKKKMKLGGSTDLLALIQISHLIKFNNISFNKAKKFYDYISGL